MGIDLVILLILALIYLIGQLSYEHVIIDSSILYPDTTLHFSNLDLLTHKKNLISTLQERESLDHNSILSVKDWISQTRSIYIGIVGILLTFILGKSENIKSYFVLLSIITLFYGLDIHLKDRKNISEQSKALTSNTLDDILNQRPNATIWYDINYTQRNNQFERAHNTRIPRKICKAFKPNIEQGLFFILPFVIVYRYSTFKYRGKLYKKFLIVLSSCGFIQLS